MENKIELPDCNLAALQAFARRLGETIPPATILLLSGDLGAGKTTFVQALGEGLGIKEPILSPTFTLINEYVEGRLPLYHIDLYRLQPEDVESLALETYWDGIEVEAGITAIEWAERLSEFPPNYWSITLYSTPQNTRRLVFEKVGDFGIDN
ncbi:tRNA (adenosine(37)-N6)-threonylcarbamoyltransferase complex ATPase subunit type 1 TsaE [Spirulina subsalsa]|uniref:tRNA (adenosine(37)-N6)-threonylcarbamoyltransferase complex ATPase subunit type 1 TsaE n=1 Tax=Spirulina subsalsa TaxID=54311 RepID=UPI0002E0AE47|nr:tRNA (adenosine(37)-N6)-threonylcarbamoyltransferase complex ATPase subunit type 1 TsaE [Spirulina subsalsa]